MKILIACEESQRVCVAFRNKGHEAYSCDILPCSGGHPDWHIQDDVKPLLDGCCRFFTMDGKAHDILEWDMIIAFPPCTYFTCASACRMFHKDENGISHLDKERYEKMLVFRDLFYAIYNASCPKIVIENPTYMKIAELPKHSQVIQPWQFGEPWTKRTCLWLKGVKDLKPTNIVEPTNGPWVSSGSTYRRYGFSNGKVKSIERSKTFQGIADAMADQWG